jgi:hypothetical protein
MNCPKCNVVMKPLGKVECKTGDCQKHRCIKCGAIHFEQITIRFEDTPPLKETLRRVAVYANA